MKIIKTPWKAEFTSLVRGAKYSIRMTSPFIKEGICDEILANKKGETKLDLVTSFKLSSIHSGSLDLRGIEKLNSAGATIKNFTKLHAKIYIFDNKKAIISSGNLTYGGLVHNYEYGILLENPELVNIAVNDFDAIFTNSNTGAIDNQYLSIARRIITNMPPLHRPEMALPEIAENHEKDELLLTDITPIVNNLSGWKKQTFITVDKIQSQLFSLSDLYQYENQFQVLFPKNNNVKDKLRQQLQMLRDLGLIEFLGDGNYRKLWRLT